MTASGRVARASGVVIATMIAASADAQFASPPPVESRESVLAGVGGRPAESLVLTTGAGAGYDDNLAVGNEPFLVDAGSATRIARDAFGQFWGALDYSLTRPRVTVTGHAAAFLDRYQTADRSVDREQGSVDAGIGLTRTTRLRISEALWFRPYYLFATTTSGNAEPASSRINTLSNSTTLELTRSLPNRASLTGAYSYQTDSTGDARFDLRVHSAALSFARAVSDNASLNLAYGHRQGAFGPGASATSLQVDDVGATFDYRWRRSASRAANLSLSSGVSHVNSWLDHGFVLTGGTRFTSAVGRTWTASAWYERSASMVAPFPEPVVSDSAAAGVAGLLNRRLELHAATEATVGHLGGPNLSAPFHMYRARAGTMVALGRRVGLATEYLYDIYRFDESTVLPPGLSHRMNRHAVTVQVVTMLPLFARHSGGRDASR